MSRVGSANCGDEVIARVVGAASAIAAADWDACAGSANPFVSHAFFVALEESGSATARAGWQPVHIVIDDADGRPAAIAPAYAKSHRDRKSTRLNSSH